MTELLELEKHHKVLEIGTGTGYQTAVLAELAGEVYTVEIDPDLHKLAQSNLSEFNYPNIHFLLGDGNEGHEAAAPFDAIIVTAAPANFPDKLIDQLATGGRMAVPVGTYIQILYLIKKDLEGKITKTNIFQVQFVPLR
jgi:protein-L-isoaspartate(D-aspartate) O-methyltransferase